MLWSRAAVLPFITLLLPACAGSDDESSGAAASFSGGASASMPTMPTMPTSASASDGTDSDSDSDGDNPTSGPPPDPTNASSTPMPVCGNNIVEDDEACDSDNLEGKDCLSFGFDMGSLSCDVGCQFDTSLCAIPGCGDGVLMGGEECDCGAQAGACTPEGLNTYECTDLMSPKGNKYNGGTLGCNSPDACNFNKAGCTYCGDAVVGPEEDCDGGNVGGQTCVSIGFKDGTLGCNANDCTFNTAGCTNVVCGDGECGDGEDECVCPDDCPDPDPMSCSTCECGGQSSMCGCDLLCLAFNDCCANGPC